MGLIENQKGIAFQFLIPYSKVTSSLKSLLLILKPFFTKTKTRQQKSRSVLRTPFWKIPTLHPLRAPHFVCNFVYSHLMILHNNSKLPLNQIIQ
jgi:hypothetical protein